MNSKKIKLILDKINTLIVKKALFRWKWISWYRFQSSARMVVSYSTMGFLVCCIFFTIIWNIKNVTGLGADLNPIIWRTGQFLGLSQNWGMFAPRVFKDDGWYILEGRTRQNKIIDLIREGQAVNYSKPKNLVSTFKNDRWRKYSENYLFVSNNYMRPFFCNFRLKEWNESHPANPIQEFKVVYMKEVTRPDYQYVVPKREVLAWVSL